MTLLFARFQVNILDDSWVVLEFFKIREGVEKVLEVFRISPDGLVVSCIY